ncbi:MAG: hypothetical protein QM520_03995 [Gammaproteobacteria bacterium]|nr:hypothetical protein [Gammaproteobacteria bacterium]
MFKKKPTPKPPSEQPMETDSATPKYHHPKILLIDTVPEIAETLTKEGYNVSNETFGKPYKVPKDSSYRPVVVKTSLLKFTEQEIVVIDLVTGDPEAGPPAEKMTPAGELDWWSKCSSGVIDPRPRAMDMVRDKFDRILDNGGAFIIFSDAKVTQKLVLAADDDRANKLSIQQDIEKDNWSFLSILSKLSIHHDYGEEITVINQKSPLDRILDDHLKDATFYCTFSKDSWQWGPNIKERWGWNELAKNKYGATVASMIRRNDNTEGGWIFILPRIKRIDLFLSEFFKNILPDMCPGLFPHAEGQKWVHRPEYELPSVLEKAAQISTIKDDAARKVSYLEKAIENDRNESAFLYALIRETGDPLVEAVEKALALLGFKSIVNVDEEMTKAGKEASLREDLRIHDQSPVLVVDIKGVAGKPADADALQAQKHALIYIREQNRADVGGLTIINHQRILPPLERDNDMPYRKEILHNAEQSKLGLMTGWDLFRLVRGFIQNKWKPEHVTPLFYQTGRILPIPRHYEYAGKVKQVWKTAFSVEIEQGEIHVGESVAFEFPVDFDEQKVMSLQLNDSDVEVATAKCEVGIQREEASPKVKTGMAVYRIK